MWRVGCAGGYPRAPPAGPANRTAPSRLAPKPPGAGFSLTFRLSELGEAQPRCSSRGAALHWQCRARRAPAVVIFIDAGHRWNPLGDTMCALQLDDGRELRSELLIAAGDGADSDGAQTSLHRPPGTPTHQDSPGGVQFCAQRSGAPKQPPWSTFSFPGLRVLACRFSTAARRSCGALAAEATRPPPPGVPSTPRLSVAAVAAAISYCPSFLCNCTTAGREFSAQAAYAMD